MELMFAMRVLSLLTGKFLLNLASMCAGTVEQILPETKKRKIIAKMGKMVKHMNDSGLRFYFGK